MSAPEVSIKGPNTIHPGDMIEVEVSRCWGRWKWCKRKKMIPRNYECKEIKALRDRVDIVASALNPDRKEIRKIMERRNTDGTISASLQISWE